MRPVRAPMSASASAKSAVLAGLAALLLVVQPAAAWVASTNSIAATPGSGPGPVAVASPDIPVAWPVAPPAEGCLPPALGVFKVLAVVLGAIAAIKLPLVLAKVMLAKVLLLLPLALPLALPLLAPFMMIASMLPIPGMDDASASDSPAAGGGGAGKPDGGPPANGNATPAETPEEQNSRAIWVERCVQRVACQLNARGSRKECARFHCAALDWLGGS